MTDLISRLIDLAIAIQQIPAPTFAESARADFVQEKFRAGLVRCASPRDPVICG